MPHKLIGINDATSLIAKMKKEPSRYPNILIATNNDCKNTLKITISNFKNLLEKSYLYDAICSI